MRTPVFRSPACQPEAQPHRHRLPPPHAPAPAGGYYSPATYLLAKMVLDALLLRVIPVFIFSAPFYPMVGVHVVCVCVCVCWECLFAMCAVRLSGCVWEAARVGPQRWRILTGPAGAPPGLRPSLGVQMGLQTGSATIATFLMVLASFAGGERQASGQADEQKGGHTRLLPGPPPALRLRSTYSQTTCASRRSASLPCVHLPPPPPPPLRPPAAVGALSLAVTVGSSTAGVASLVMNIVLLLSVVVSGAPLPPRCPPLRLPRPCHAAHRLPLAPPPRGAPPLLPLVCSSPL